MSNCIGFCDNFESVGQTSVWDEHGNLKDTPESPEKKQHKKMCTRQKDEELLTFFFKTTIRLNLNLQECPTCDSLEYACTCDHSEDEDKKKKK